MKYMGTANKSLRFFHVVEKEDRFKLWIGFDNCGVFTTEEGVMSLEDILKNLKDLFDKDWLWHATEATR